MRSAASRRRRRAPARPTLDVTANIDKAYVTSGEQRMDLYRRMAGIRSQSDADELLDEIVDRYGDPPRGVMNLIAIALLRARASAAGIRDIAQKGRTLRFRLAQFDFAVVSRVAGQYQKRMFVEPKSEEPPSRSATRRRIPAGRGKVRKDLSGRVDAARFAAARATRDTAVYGHGTQFTALR